ncbi:unnamed protein product, partial [Iphiclides podalirius]
MHNPSMMRQLCDKGRFGRRPSSEAAWEATASWSEAILDNGQCRLFETTGGWWEIRGAVTNVKMTDDCGATGDRRSFVRVGVLQGAPSPLESACCGRERREKLK